MILKTSSLPPAALSVIRDKATERPYMGEYATDDISKTIEEENKLERAGTYLCRQCGLALFRAESQFPSGCGWPSFDAEITGAVQHARDADGQRTEILCARCAAHLGHIFEGEGFTQRNLRYCVNSISLDFVANSTVVDSEEAIVAGGCFWGVEYLFMQLPGVLKAEVGYTGGDKINPSYDDVCAGNTGHYEAVRVLFDPSVINYEKIIQYFFEIHDPTQGDGQGPDRGTQYFSAIFYYNDVQKKVTEALIEILTQRGYNIKTRVLPVNFFWKAETYHQEYYQRLGKMPYCHRYEKRF